MEKVFKFLSLEKNKKLKNKKNNEK